MSDSQPIPGQTFSHYRIVEQLGGVMNKRPQRKTGTDIYWLSSFYAGNGEREKALATLQKAFELGFRDFGAIDANPAFSGLRDDPQFQEMLHHYSE